MTHPPSRPAALAPTCELERQDLVLPTSRTLVPPSNRGVISTSDSRAVTNPDPAAVLSGGAAGAERVLGEVSYEDLKRGRALRVSLHYLAATTRVNDLSLCVGYITTALGYSPIKWHSGHFSYTETYMWTGGLKIMHNPNRPEMGVCLLVEGQACEHYGLEVLLDIYQALQFKATQIDIAVDGCRFAPSALRKLWFRGWVRCSARRSQKAKPARRKRRRYSWCDSTDGDTFYMGSRSSSCYARVYNERGFTRFEIVLREGRAAQVMDALCSGSELATTAGAVIKQYVTFVEPRGKNLSRAKPLPFWTKFLEKLTTNDVVTRLDPRPELTVSRFLDWMETVVARHFAVYCVLKGTRDDYGDVERELRRLGWERATAKHYGLIEAGGGWLHEHDELRFKVIKDKPLSLLELNEKIKKAA